MRKFLAHLRGQWIGVLALLIALGTGSAYAANTVFSADIVDGQVKTADLAIDAVRAKHIASGQVTPSDLRPAEPWHEVGTPGEPAFLGTNVVPEDLWTNHDAEHNTAGFYRDPYGLVHLKGLVKSTVASGAVTDASDDMFFLPAGYRPAKVIGLTTSSEGKFARVAVLPTGQVLADAPFDYGSLYLDNLSFRCAPQGHSGCP